MKQYHLIKVNIMNKALATKLVLQEKFICSHLYDFAFFTKFAFYF